MTADVDIHEPKSQVDAESPFSFSMEGENPGDQDGSTIPYAWSPGWNSNQSVFKFQQEVGGELAGGDPGEILLKVSPEPSGAIELVARTDDSSNLSDETNGSLAVVPVPLIFGSDELSSHSWPIAARMPNPFVLLSDEDAQRVGVSPGEGIRILECGQSLEVQIDGRLTSGSIGIPQVFIDDYESLPRTVNVEVDPDFVGASPSSEDVIARG